MTPGPSRLIHALSVDLEDWYSATVLALSGQVSPPTTATVRAADSLLALLAEYGVRATWFVLGDVAAAFPGLIRRIAEAGHELGVHGYHHHRIYELSPAGFRSAIRRAKDATENAGGQRVLGHRAVAFSLLPATRWALDVLAELGFAYDSSVFPFRGTRYGLPNAPVVPYRIETPYGWLTEVPLSVVELGPVRLPCCGGGYLRHFPMAFTNWALRKLERDGRSCISYLHPYELDLEYDESYLRRHLTNQEFSRLRRIRWAQYRNRHQTEEKLRTLLSKYRFGRVADLLAGPGQKVATVVP